MPEKRNIPLLFIIKIAKWFMLYIPVIYLFYQENGFEVTELFGLHAIYSVVIAFLEVPSGYFADVFGRKLSLITGSLFGVLGFSAYSMSTGISGFIIAEVFLGIGQSLFSGADSALLYDTLLQQKNEKKYLKFEGRITGIGNLSEALAGLTVSILAFETIRIYFYFQVILALIALIAALFLIEPQIHEKRKKPGYKDILNIVTETFRKNKGLRNLVLFSSVIGFASLTMAWFSQPVFDFVGLNKNYFGYAAVILNVLVALGSMFAARINSWFKRSGIFYILGFTLSSGFIIVGLFNTYLVFIPLILFYLIRGTAHPILKNYINEITTSDKRATVLSLRSLIIRILFSGIAPILGVISDKIKLQTALMVCGATVSVLCVGIILLFTLNKSKSETTF